jgi:hypothetical protein
VFVEVTTFRPTEEDVSEATRRAAVYNALSRVKLPPEWRLGFNVLDYGTLTPPLNKFRQSVEEWASNVAAAADSNPNPENVFDFDDWSIEITLLGGFRRDRTPERSIAADIGDARWLSPELEIRQALKRKGGRYGAMNAPYLIVVADCKDELMGGDIAEALLEALFGTIVTQIGSDESGGHYQVETRRADGYWGWPSGPRHKNVSGVILLPKPHLWDLRHDRWQPLLVKNPWAEHALPNELFPIPEYALNYEGEFAPVRGTRLADILGLPTLWPPRGTGVSHSSGHFPVSPPSFT